MYRRVPLRIYSELRIAHKAKLSCETPPEYTLFIKPDDVKRFCIACMQKVNASEKHSRELADVLVEGDYRGHYSHGLNRLVKAEPTVVKESASTALIEGNNALGPVVGNISMKLAIQKAKQTGVSWVAARGSNHYGIAGWYSLQAVRENFIMAVGTNPITVAAPGKGPGDDFVLDMATSAVAVGKIEMNRRRKLKIPEGWGGDSDGKVTRDPETVMNGGGLFPLGGTEETSGYKGYGLGMMVELFCGILAGSAWGPNIRRWMNATRPANLSDPDLAVLVPGDPERAHMAECDNQGAIRYPPVLIDSLNSLADRIGVTRLKIIKTLDQ